MPFIVDLASAGLGGGLGAKAGIADAQRQDIATNMQLHQMQQQEQQAAWERDFRTRQAQQAAQQQAVENQFRQQQLQALAQQQQQSNQLRQQAIQSQNTRSDATNQTRLTLAQLAQQTAYDRMNMQDDQFEKTFGLKKADYDTDLEIAKKKLVQGDQRIKQAYDLAQQRLQSGEDARAVQRALQQAIHEANAADSAAKYNVSEAHRAWNQSHQAAVDEYNALIAKPPTSLTPAERARMGVLPGLIAAPPPAAQTVAPTPLQVPATQPAASQQTARPAAAPSPYSYNAPIPIADKVSRKENLSNADMMALLSAMGGDPQMVVSYLFNNGYDDKGNRVVR